MTLALLVLLAVVDGGFAGFRAAAGRSPLLHKWRNGLYPRAIRRGVIIACVGLLAPAVALLSWATTSSEGFGAGLAIVDDVAGPMAWLLSAFTLVVLGAFVPWRFAGVELRTFISVTVFGPLTLLRPVVVLLALVVAVMRQPAVGPALVLAAGAAAALLVEPILNRKP